MKTHLFVDYKTGLLWNYVAVKCGRWFKVDKRVQMDQAADKLLESKQVTLERIEVTCANCKRVMDADDNLKRKNNEQHFN